MPKPLSAYLGDDFIYESVPMHFVDAPHVTPHMSTAMRFISTVSELDSLITSFVVQFLKADFVVTATILQEFTSGRVRGEAIRKAAENAEMPSDQLSVFKTALKVLGRVRERRNEYAHHIWMTILNQPSLPDCVLLVDPIDHHLTDARFEKSLRKSIKEKTNVFIMAEGYRIHPSKINVFTTSEIEHDYECAVSLLRPFLGLQYIRLKDFRESVKADLENPLLPSPHIK